MAMRLASEVDWRDVYPNPRVGCVIVKDGEVVASGVHEKYGGAHAEVNALGCLSPGLSLGDHATKPGLVGDAGRLVVYVTLEPCDCFPGKKTGSCVDRLIELNPDKVVVGCIDDRFGGNNVQKLRDVGIEVEVRNDEGCRDLARLRPRVILKMAQTLDGKIAPHPQPLSQRERGASEDKCLPLKSRGGEKKKGPVYISSLASRKKVHELRARVDGILTTTETVLVDNPLLDCRLVEGKASDLFVFGKSGIPDEARIFQIPGRRVMRLDGNDLGRDLREISEMGMRMVMTECGPMMATSLLRGGFVDELWILIAPVIWGDGKDVFLKEVDLSGFKMVSVGEIEGDVLVIYKKTPHVV